MNDKNGIWIKKTNGERNGKFGNLNKEIEKQEKYIGALTYYVCVINQTTKLRKI